MYEPKISRSSPVPGGKESICAKRQEPSKTIKIISIWRPILSFEHTNSKRSLIQSYFVGATYTWSQTAGCESNSEALNLNHQPSSSVCDLLFLCSPRQAVSYLLVFATKQMERRCADGSGPLTQDSVVDVWDFRVVVMGDTKRPGGPITAISVTL